ncbi:SMI1/KNR4 family protein [Solibacillus cecembensis]|uniref:SMI1/KNR4 family protein n=1 Tax=Solibacillus cecembensis TaxID=459347 RepID=UPI003D0380DA
MDERIIKMIENYGEEDDFFGEISEEYINKAEEKLRVKFPLSYRNFIKKYGSGEFARCMYCADINDDRIFSLERGGIDLHPRYNTFDDYLIDIFQEGIDNW